VLAAKAISSLPVGGGLGRDARSDTRLSHGSAELADLGVQSDTAWTTSAPNQVSWLLSNAPSPVVHVRCSIVVGIESEEGDGG
jgi:hypothetical protein